MVRGVVSKAVSVKMHGEERDSGKAQQRGLTELKQNRCLSQFKRKHDEEMNHARNADIRDMCEIKKMED